MLNPATRLTALIGLFIDLSPILRGTADPPKMYVVKLVFVLEGPIFVEIIDLKGDIGRYPAGLDRRDIRTDDFAVWEFIGNIDGPYSCTSGLVSHKLIGSYQKICSETRLTGACANIKDVLWVIGDRSRVKLTVVENSYDMVATGWQRVVSTKCGIG